MFNSPGYGDVFFGRCEFGSCRVINDSGFRAPRVASAKDWVTRPELFRADMGSSAWFGAVRCHDAYPAFAVISTSKPTGAQMTWTCLLTPTECKNLTNQQAQHSLLDQAIYKPYCRLIGLIDTYALLTRGITDGYSAEDYFDEYCHGSLHGRGHCAKAY